MKSLLFVFPVVLLATSFGEVIHGNHDTNTTHSEVNVDMSYIGESDGIAYYWDDTKTERDWFKARQYCGMHGLNLAVINTRTQLNMLAFSLAFPSGLPFWTGGRDADKIRQFSWDHNNLEVSDVLTGVYKQSYSNLYFKSCLRMVKSPTAFEMRAYDCNSPCLTICST